METPVQLCETLEGEPMQQEHPATLRQRQAGLLLPSRCSDMLRHGPTLLAIQVRDSAQVAPWRPRACSPSCSCPVT